MESTNSPFSASTFQKIWKKHFIPNSTVESFKFIDGVNFYKSKLALFFNVGKNLTKGNSYKLNDVPDYKNKTFIIYDVLPHLDTEQSNSPKGIGVLKSNQYPGFLIHLDKFKNIDDYLLNTFSKNTRMKMRKFNKRLDACFNISTKMFFGNIDKEEYNEIFDNFMILLKKRYAEKQVSYNNMQASEWAFYKEVAYPLILEKKASLFVVYDNNIPIAITYNYHTKDSLIDAITVYDIDYSKFNIGYVNNLKILNWCFDNNLKVLDFSKGYFDYKKRMCTLEYDFEYHIIYDKKSILSKLKAHIYYNFFELKTYLRHKKWDVKLHRFTYNLKSKKQEKTNQNVEIKKLDVLPNSDELIKIDIKEDTKYNFLTRYVNDFLYLAIKPYTDIEVFKINNDESIFIFSSNTLIQQVEFIT
ncbi:hypothetical protein DIS18_09140 [Algibacter marinivivus]|uniref:BioF2-like acetyltransferase domain-containing protein n=1 Tax=Algibacter marinivivus TaxID=2100723 RepID=A0A2U2X3Q1_9FLAO|nr:GNAT family N-acetyltransferase [Algibacter marinivivus]PWH82408.1 hypothetical protein DIS18_09140 [Algibacter marinivivus]